MALIDTGKTVNVNVKGSIKVAKVYEETIDVKKEYNPETLKMLKADLQAQIVEIDALLAQMV